MIDELKQHINVLRGRKKNCYIACLCPYFYLIKLFDEYNCDGCVYERSRHDFCVGRDYKGFCLK